MEVSGVEVDSKPRAPHIANEGQHTFGRQNCVAKSLFDLLKRDLSGFNYVARNNVRVDHCDTAISEQIGDGRLATGDTAGQADAQWPCHLGELVQVRIPDLLAPEHRYPAGCCEVGSERDR